MLTWLQCCTVDEASSVGGRDRPVTSDRVRYVAGRASDPGTAARARAGVRRRRTPGLGYDPENFPANYAVED